MKTKIITTMLVLIMSGTMVFCTKQYYIGQKRIITNKKRATERFGLLYLLHASRCEMDKPGKCPKCGMILEKKTIKTTGTKSEKNEAMKTYTCPMHPDVISEKPGKCPRCGMDLTEKK